jgi:ubiquinone/menaquinone biosynthesis C-methylase UbiE
MANEPQPSDQGYLIDAESATEMARQLHQDRLITKGMGGLFPERSDLTTIHRILDVACGPGGWVIDIAREYPEIEAVGIDVSRTMVEYARAQASSRGFDNASFKVMNALESLDFPDSSFDLVNARLFGFIPTAAWPNLMREYMRVIRPGGVIRLTEFEGLGISNSLSLEKLIRTFARALKLAGQNFSPDGERIGIAPMLGGLLRDVGCKNIQQRAHVIDYSTGTEFHEGFRQDWMVAFKLARPAFVGAGVITEEEFDQLYQQMLIDMLSDEFRGIMFLLTAWGEKP